MHSASLRPLRKTFFPEQPTYVGRAAYALQLSDCFKNSFLDARYEMGYFGKKLKYKLWYSCMGVLWGTILTGLAFGHIYLENSSQIFPNFPKSKILRSSELMFGTGLWRPNVTWNPWSCLTTTYCLNDRHLDSPFSSNYMRRLFLETFANEQ
jgi:hypothetical protein